MQCSGDKNLFVSQFYLSILQGKYRAISQVSKMKSTVSIFALIAIFAFAESFPAKDESVSSFIVNGRDANIADFPHHLGLFDQGRFFCGSSVLSPQFALTAAHCLDLNTPPTLLNLWGGTSNRVSGGHLFFIESYHLHPQYRRIPLSTGQVIWDYDVAVIRVFEGTRLEGFPFIEPIALPPPCASECCGTCGGVRISMAGWGRLANGTLPTYLQQLEQDIIPQSECRNHWEGQITSRMFCVTSYFYDSCEFIEDENNFLLN